MNDSRKTSHQSGDMGFCQLSGKSKGIVRYWEDDKVVSVDCGHETCGYSQCCDLYQRFPVGYSQTKPSH